MATITNAINTAYVSGNVALSLTKGELAIICVHWTWNTSVSYQYNTGSILVDGADIGGYSQYIAENGDAKGDFMKIGCYLAVATASVNISLSPTDTIAQERYIQLTVIKLTPADGKQFSASAFLVGSTTRPRDSAIGNHTVTPPNAKDDIMVGCAFSLNANGTLQIAWTAPATEQVDMYVNAYNEVSVATQVSENDSDEFSWTQNAGMYNGGVAISVRELAFESEMIWWW